MFALICLFLPLVFIANEWCGLAPTWGRIDKLIKMLGVISGFVAVLGGKSASAQTRYYQSAPKSDLTKTYELVIRFATLFFIAFLFMALAYVERMIAEKLVRRPVTPWHLSETFRFSSSRACCFPDWLRADLSSLVSCSRKMAVLFAAVLLLFVVSAFGYVCEPMGVGSSAQSHSPGKQMLMAQGFIAERAVPDHHGRLDGRSTSTAFRCTASIATGWCVPSLAVRARAARQTLSRISIPPTTTASAS